MEGIIIKSVVYLCVLFLVVIIQHWRDKMKLLRMKKQELIFALDLIISSFRSNPQQFKLNVNTVTVGSIGIGGSGGPGIVGIANGSGGTNIGHQSSALTGKVEITKMVGGALDAELSKALALLDDLKKQIEKDAKDKTIIKSLMGKISTSIMPEVITKLISKMLCQMMPL